MIYKDFLFTDFLETFKKTFDFPKLDNPNLNAFYSWQDFEYKEFMIDILQSLEPRCEEKNSILINELDEQNEVLFFNNGTNLNFPNFSFLYFVLDCFVTLNIV